MTKDALPGTTLQDRPVRLSRLVLGGDVCAPPRPRRPVPDPAAAELMQLRAEVMALRFGMAEIAAELARLRDFVQRVADRSTDPAVAREAKAHGAK